MRSLLTADHSTRSVHGTAVVGGSNVREVRSPRLVSNVSCGRVSRQLAVAPEISGKNLAAVTSTHHRSHQRILPAADKTYTRI